jgi:hypothetical protein
MRRPLPDKGKPTVRWGRKAQGQGPALTARLPKEGRYGLPGNRVVSRNGGNRHVPGVSYSCR